MCGLTEDEVLAIAEHEHLPEIAATALAHYLLSRENGSEEIRDMIVDDIPEAQWSDNKEHVLTLLHVLHHFHITPLKLGHPNILGAVASERSTASSGHHFQREAGIAVHELA
jgi:hypothetical protein